MLFGNEASEVARASKLDIAADGILNCLPFEALLTDSQAGVFSLSLASRDVVYVPSASLWNLEHRPGKESGNEFLAIGFAGSPSI